MRALCATDLSAASEVAIQNQTCLDCLGRIGVDEIHLVTVVSSNVHAGMPGIDFESRRGAALDRYCDVITRAGFDVETHVVRGTPHRRINGIAEAIVADLVVVGSRGKSPLENRVIGSTARNLARTTVVPLVVNRIERGDEDLAPVRKHLFRHVLYTTDFSENASRAFEAFTYLRHATRRATLVHVRTPKDPELTAAEHPSAMDRLRERAETLEEWGIETEIDVREGDPAGEILRSEAAHSPTITLVGSRGQSRMRRLLLGSVSEQIVAEADANVLLVPPSRA
ncbi:MAG: universal stress protein [Natronomonas sp.]|uniref:universal stress protein n=1 Tax=Natronomonas sp. TaxID=2184060 RepID=UPI0028700A0B|nr:universal stress protein [Natronomonas sp.]MDR9381704.1 universal stress protein [Natronomonas sp.]MDR9430365.1 universal stress protein [Natronomonas sp.]